MSSINTIAGIRKAAVWLPEEYEDGEFISEQTKIPLQVVKEKMGIIRKCRATREMQPSQMAINAAEDVLEGIDRDSIDVILWTGSEYKDYPVWSAGIFVQEALKLRKAWAMDISARCSTNVVGLKMAQTIIAADPKVNRVLLLGGHKTGDLVNYQDPKARFLYSLSDGGSAVLVERGWDNHIGASKVITDGAFSCDVIIPAGGTKNPLLEDYTDDMTYLNVPDIEGMRVRLADKTLANFLDVIRTAAQDTSDRLIDYLAILHLKRSIHNTILDQLELKPENSNYMDYFGHFGAPDQILSLGLAEIHNQLKPGDKTILASAGIGYTWSAIAVTWDKPIFSEKTKQMISRVGGLL